MAIPTNREQHKDWCLRQLGHPVININVDDDQVDDCVDASLQYFQDFHFDGVERWYLKHQLTETDIQNQYIPITDNIIGSDVTAENLRLYGMALEIAQNSRVERNIVKNIINTAAQQAWGIAVYDGFKNGKITNNKIEKVSAGSGAFVGMGFWLPRQTWKTLHLCRKSSKEKPATQYHYWPLRPDKAYRGASRVQKIPTW